MHKLFLLFLVIIFTLALIFSNTTYAADGPKDVDGGSIEEKLVTLPNPLNPSGAEATKVTPQTLIGTIINAVLSIVGSIALIMFIYGGFTWMTAAGNQERVTKGKDILVWATIGLIFIFTSYALVKFVFTGLGVG